MLKLPLILFLMLAASFSAFAQEDQPKSDGKTTPLKITKKVQPTCTEEAIAARVEGTVTLSVVFLANGEIGKITYVKPSGHYLLKEDKLEKYGLVRKAIEAAKQLEFIPAMRDGEPITVTKRVQYVFDN